MGSMRYYSNSIDGNVGPNDSRIVQAMNVYVYEDRVELRMKNYGESGTINGITINKNLEPYVSYRTVTHSEEVVTAAPAFATEVVKDTIALGTTVRIEMEVPEWHNVYYTIDGTEPTEASARVSNGVIEWTPKAIGEYTFKVAAQEGVRLMSKSIAYNLCVVSEENFVGVETATMNSANVYAYSEGVSVRGFTGLVKIHNILGQQSKEVLTEGNVDIMLDKGVYIVVLGAKAYKVVVK